MVTLETYYHNVAEVEKEAGSGITHWFEKDRKLWIEYTGIVKIGIDIYISNLLFFIFFNILITLFPILLYHKKKRFLHINFKSLCFG